MQFDFRVSAPVKINTEERLKGCIDKIFTKVCMNVCVCVCVCEREREREREMSVDIVSTSPKIEG